MLEGDVAAICEDQPIAVPITVAGDTVARPAKLVSAVCHYGLQPSLMNVRHKQMAQRFFAVALSPTLECRKCDFEQNDQYGEGDKQFN